MATTTILPLPADVVRYNTQSAEVSVPGSEADKSGSQPVKLLDQQNPEYTSRIEAWIDLSLLYEGGTTLRKHADRLLKKRPREDNDVYTARIDKFTDQGLLGTALGWYSSAMFKDDPEIFFRDTKGNELAKDPSDFYTKFLDDCDGCGTRYIDFARKIFPTMLTYGSAWVLTDLRALGENEPYPETLEDQRQAGLLDPHLALYTPINVINWRCDKRGVLEWCVMKTTIQEQGFLEKPQVVDTWYYWDRTNYRVYEDRRDAGQPSIPADGSGRSARLLREGRHALAEKQRVPVRRLQLSEGLWLANRAYLALIDHINQNNTLAWALFMSNLAIPVIIGDVDTTNMTQSEVGYLQFPAGTTYAWSEPGGNSFQHSAQRLESLREEIFRSWHLQAQGRSMSATPAMQSGRSKQLEMVPAHDVLAGMGDDVRRCMQEILQDVVDARQENVAPDVRGLNFEDDMTTEEVFAVNALLSMRIPSAKFEKYIYKKVAKSWMPDAARKDIEDIYREIDAGPTIDDRMAADLQKRIALAKAGMEAALTKKIPGSMPVQPPGRGGAGPSPAASSRAGSEG